MLILHLYIDLNLAALTRSVMAHILGLTCQTTKLYFGSVSLSHTHTPTHTLWTEENQFSTFPLSRLSWTAALGKAKVRPESFILVSPLPLKKASSYYIPRRECPMAQCTPGSGHNAYVQAVSSFCWQTPVVYPRLCSRLHKTFVIEAALENAFPWPLQLPKLIEK